MISSSFQAGKKNVIDGIGSPGVARADGIAVTIAHPGALWGDRPAPGVGAGTHRLAGARPGRDGARGRLDRPGPGPQRSTLVAGRALLEDPAVGRVDAPGGGVDGEALGDPLEAGLAHPAPP